jgi:hypothetical protein
MCGFYMVTCKLHCICGEDMDSTNIRSCSRLPMQRNSNTGLDNSRCITGYII